MHGWSQKQLMQITARGEWDKEKLKGKLGRVFRQIGCKAEA
jgi:hypothetical protein